MNSFSRNSAARKLANAVTGLCPKVPSDSASMCPNVPSPPAEQRQESAQTCPNLPDSALAGADEQIGKTKPPDPIDAAAPEALARRLSDTQLAAARLVVAGYGSKKIAAHLGLNHHTIGRWKRDLSFVSEVERLRAQVTTMTLAHAAAAAAAGTRRLPPAATTLKNGPARAEPPLSPRHQASLDHVLGQRFKAGGCQ